MASEAKTQVRFYLTRKELNFLTEAARASSMDLTTWMRHILAAAAQARLGRIIPQKKAKP